MYDNNINLRRTLLKAEWKWIQKVSRQSMNGSGARARVQLCFLAVACSPLVSPSMASSHRCNSLDFTDLFGMVSSGWQPIQHDNLNKWPLEGTIDISDVPLIFCQAAGCGRFWWGLAIPSWPQRRVPFPGLKACTYKKNHLLPKQKYQKDTNCLWPPHPLGVLQHHKVLQEY